MCRRERQALLGADDARRAIRAGAKLRAGKRAEGNNSEYVCGYVTCCDLSTVCDGRRAIRAVDKWYQRQKGEGKIPYVTLPSSSSRRRTACDRQEGDDGKNAKGKNKCMTLPCPSDAQTQWSRHLTACGRHEDQHMDPRAHAPPNPKFQRTGSRTRTVSLIAIYHVIRAVHPRHPRTLRNATADSGYPGFLVTCRAQGGGKQGTKK